MMRSSTLRGSVFSLSLCAVLLAAGCTEPIKKEASYPTRNAGSDKIVYTDEKRETIWSDGESLGSKIFGSKDGKDNSGGGGIGVNSFLWRASLDTLSFMPIASADPFGGVILTDWYENPQQPGERYKANVYILDKQLRADGVRVAIFKQTRDMNAGGWRDVAVAPKMSDDIENTILTRARELRVAQMGRNKT